MSFDEVLRRAEELKNATAASQEAWFSQALEARADEERFREELRTFGRWFAEQARLEGLPPQPLIFKKTEPAPPGRKGGWFRQPTDPAPVERVDSIPGWVIQPARPGDPMPLRHWEEYDKVWSRGDLVSSKRAYPCLTVDVNGEVRVGAETDEGTFIGGIPVRHVGAGPDQLTRSRLVFDVANMGSSGTLDFSPAMAEYNDQINRANADAQAGIVTSYAAGGKLLLDQWRRNRNLPG